VLQGQLGVLVLQVQLVRLVQPGQPELSVTLVQPVIPEKLEVLVLPVRLAKQVQQEIQEQ